MQQYDIRAEFEGNKYVDFKISGEDQIEVRAKAEAYIRSTRGLPYYTTYDWRGMVVFVDHSPSV